MKFEKDQIKEAIQFLLANELDISSIEIKTKKQRTLTQNAAMHKWFSLMTEALNDAGYSFTHFAARRNKKGYKVSWTDEQFKREVWWPIQLALYPDAVNSKGEPSTTKLNTDQVSKVYEECNRAMANISGVSMPFPDRFHAI
jgi:hypothetical protein